MKILPMGIIGRISKTATRAIAVRDSMPFGLIYDPDLFG